MEALLLFIWLFIILDIFSDIHVNKDENEEGTILRVKSTNGSSCDFSLKSKIKNIILYPKLIEISWMQGGQLI